MNSYGIFQMFVPKASKTKYNSEMVSYWKPAKFRSIFCYVAAFSE